MDEKSNENILIYNFLYKNVIGAELLCIIFIKVDGFIRDYGGTKNFAWVGSGKCNTIFYKVEFIMKIRSSIP